MKYTGKRKKSDYFSGPPVVAICACGNERLVSRRAWFPGVSKPVCECGGKMYLRDKHLVVTCLGFVEKRS